jgi:gamma-glutamylcyclotransferase (GGCT)/AIG2-like uncharacterized protein YtfP
LLIYNIEFYFNTRGEAKHMHSKVFVYGTLMQGRCNHYLLKNSTFIGKGMAKGVGLYTVSSDYPGAVLEKGETVLGEIYQVNSSTLQALDELEDNEILYKRELLPIELEKGGKIIIAWIYLWLGKISPDCKIPLKEQPWKKAT